MPPPPTAAMPDTPRTPSVPEPPAQGTDHIFHPVAHAHITMAFLTKLAIHILRKVFIRVSAKLDWLVLKLH